MIYHIPPFHYSFQTPDGCWVQWNGNSYTLPTATGGGRQSCAEQLFVFAHSSVHVFKICAYNIAIKRTDPTLCRVKGYARLGPYFLYRRSSACTYTCSYYVSVQFHDIKPTSNECCYTSLAILSCLRVHNLS